MSFTNQVLDGLGASNTLIGISSIIYMISSVTFSSLSSRNVFKGGPKVLIPTVLIIIAVYCILVPTVGSIPVIMLLQILPATSGGILFTCATSEAMKEVKPFQKSTAMGFFQAFYAIGMTVFPMMTGKLASAFNMPVGYFALVGIAVFGCLISVCFYRIGEEESIDKIVYREINKRTDNGCRWSEIGVFNLVKLIEINKYASHNWDQYFKQNRRDLIPMLELSLE